MRELTKTVQQINDRMLGVERGISDMAGLVGGSPSLAQQSSAVVSLTAPVNVDATRAQPAPVVRCGGGTAGTCDPKGASPCCSATGTCGASPEHCACKGCIDYRRQAVPLTYGPTSASNPSPASGETVVVIIPFRDREGHLVKFKEYWRWFAQEGIVPRKVSRWEVLVVEQFDSETFNRGWTFNVGLASVAAMSSASPDIDERERLNFVCAAIQDIDYLPEKGVDYTDCPHPTQLSSEIDRYQWKTPYVTSAGGIVAMNLKDWKTINGFGNDFFGWGGEDDELHHRLRLNNLLFGDCYPHCEGKGDPQKGKTGVSIRRPAKGHGRFSGKFMHSMNHTKRITDSAGYLRNIKMLQQIKDGSDRWKTDGLSNLKFRIVHTQVDLSQMSVGVHYRHIKVRRGDKPFDLKNVRLAVPASLCDSGNGIVSDVPLSSAASWSVSSLTDVGDGIPWTLAELRKRTEALLSKAGRGPCSPFIANAMNFVLVDQRYGLAKVLSDSSPHLLIQFYRSLVSPQDDALIVADSRSKPELQTAFSQTSAFSSPSTEFAVCKYALKKHGPKFSVREGSCASGWSELNGRSFRAFIKERSGLFPVTICDNEKYWIQRLVKGQRCEKKWAGLKWVQGPVFWVAEGSDFCVGTRQSLREDLSFSRVAKSSDCSNSDGFKHDFSFSASVGEKMEYSALGVCIAQGNNQRLRISQRATDCSQDGYTLKVRFQARRPERAMRSDRKLCVQRGHSGGDIISDDAGCAEDPKNVKFVFVMPASVVGDDPVSVASSRTRICVTETSVGIGTQCEGPGKGITFEAPSWIDIAASTAGLGGSRGPPLYTLVDEDSPCFGLFCDSTLNLLS